MKYLADGRPVRVGDFVSVENGVDGRVVCDFDQWVCVEGYEKFLTKDVLLGGGTLSEGILVETAAYGLIHYSSDDDSIFKKKSSENL